VVPELTTLQREQFYSGLNGSLWHDHNSKLLDHRMTGFQCRTYRGVDKENTNYKTMNFFFAKSKQ
jgi:hypothetical protein